MEPIWADGVAKDDLIAGIKNLWAKDPHTIDKGSIHTVSVVDRHCTRKHLQLRVDPRSLRVFDDQIVAEIATHRTELFPNRKDRTSAGSAANLDISSQTRF